MPETAFRLVPFQADAPVSIDGKLNLSGTRLRCCFRLYGDSHAFIIADHCGLQQRMDALWQVTCCEIFAAVPSQEVYWEYNFSPLGHWNCYRHQNYRSGTHIEASVTRADIRWQHPKLTVDVALPDAVARQPLQFAVVAGILTAEGLFHFALKHPPAKPDFHRREFFLLSFDR